MEEFKDFGELNLHPNFWDICKQIIKNFGGNIFPSKARQVHFLLILPPEIKDLNDYDIDVQHKIRVRYIYGNVYYWRIIEELLKQGGDISRV